MPDTETPDTGATEVNQAPEVIDATTPPPRGKTTDAQRIAAATAMLEAKQQKPKDATKEPAAAKEGEEPAAETEETPAEPHEQVTSAQWREFRKRSTKLEKREQTVVQRETRIAEQEKAIEEWKADKALLLSDPRAFWAKVAKVAGSSFTAEYSKFADAYMNEGKTDTRLDAALAKIEELTKEIAGGKEERQREQEAQRERQVVGNFLRVALGDEHKHTAFTYRQHGEQTVMQDATQVARALFSKLGRGPTDGEIARELDLQYAAYYKRTVDSLSGLSQPSQGATERVNGAEQPAKPVAPKAPKTLTNGGGAERAAPPLSSRKMTEKERIEAATKLLG